MLTTCYLCKEQKKLELSHVIPRAFLKRVKKGEPQLLKVEDLVGVKPVLDNANWTEHLLCKDCEHHLNISYEGSQIPYLRNGANVSKSHGKVTFRNFCFEKFYLFLLSILWRASISEHDAFKSVSLGRELNDTIAGLIRDRTTKVGGVCFSDLLKIGVVRIVDDAKSDEITRSVMTSFVLEKQQDSALYYLMLEGFLISYYLVSSPGMEMPKGLGLVKKSFLLKVPRVQVGDSEYAARLFKVLLGKAREYPHLI